MKEYKTEDIRNVVLLGHGSAGKTSLAEAILFQAGAINRGCVVCHTRTEAMAVVQVVEHSQANMIGILPVAFQGFDNGYRACPIHT